MSGGNIGKECDAVTMTAPTLRDFEDAAGADGVMHRFAKGYLAVALFNDRFEHHRRITNGHKASRVEHMHEGQRTAGRACGDRRTDGGGGIPRCAQTNVVADLEHLLDLQRPSCPEAFRPGLVVIEAQVKIAEQSFNVRVLGVHGCHHQQADGVVQGQDLVRVEHSQSLARINWGRETLRGINEERSRERRCLV
ncbi:hypothetical protein D3C84_690360 [compost metagenome]